MLMTTLRLMAHLEHTPLRSHATVSRPCVTRYGISTRARTPRLKRQLCGVGLAAALSLVGLSPGWSGTDPADQQSDDKFTFGMVPS
jgi:hypothetical protein